jgi:hypothetical protein
MATLWEKHTGGTTNDVNASRVCDKLSDPQCPRSVSNAPLQLVITAGYLLQGEICAFYLWHRMWILHWHPIRRTDGRKRPTSPRSIRLNAKRLHKHFARRLPIQRIHLSKGAKVERVVRFCEKKSLIINFSGSGHGRAESCSLR